MADEDDLRWAEALAIERQHGDDGPHWIAEWIGASARAGDVDGIARFTQVAPRYAGLLGADRRRQRPFTRIGLPGRS